MGIPPEYEEREQTFLKHEVLRRYLERWALKLGSRGQFQPTRLWYVDCFAGPWESRDVELRDTSVAIGLEALKRARDVWEEHGAPVTTAAIFVEKNRKAFKRLQEYVEDIRGPIIVNCLHGEFGEQAPRIQRQIGRDPAFLFIDPTGWKGVAMDYIGPLVQHPRRDVLINVMYEHIKRFKADLRPQLRKGLCQFFGIENNDWLKGMKEDQLLELYRRKLKEQASLEHALNLAVPFPNKEKTYFHLVVGGHHPEVVRLFRKIERTVHESIVPEVKEDVRRRRDRASGQEPFDFGDRASNRKLKQQVERARADAREMLTAMLRDGPRRYREIWPTVLEQLPLTEKDLNAEVVEMKREGVVAVGPWKRNERTIKDHQELALVRTRS